MKKDLYENKQMKEEVDAVLSQLSRGFGCLLSNRAKPSEAFLFQTLLLYIAYNGGDAATSSDPYRIEAQNTLPFFLNPVSDALNNVAYCFLHPKYPKEIYYYALSSLRIPMLDPFKYDCVQGLDLEIMGRRYSFTNTEENLFLKQLLKVEKMSILLCCPGILPLSRMEFQHFSKFDFVAVDSFSYAYLSLRKQFEGNKWSNVSIYRSIPMEGEQYDIIHIDLYSSGKIIHSDIAIEDAVNRLPLCHSGALIAHIKPIDPMSPLAAARVFNTGLLEMSVRMPERKDELYAVLRNTRPIKAPVRFIDGYSLRSALLDNKLYRINDYTETIKAIRQNDRRYVIEVSRESCVLGNLKPSFYLLRKAMYKEGQVPLKAYAALLNCESEFVACSRKIENITEDPRLIPLSPNETNGTLKHSRVLKETAILLKKATSGNFICSYTHVEKNNFLQIPKDCIVLSVNPQKADIRFIVKFLRSIPFSKNLGYDVFTSDEDILELPVPDLTLEEQQQFINDYLKSLKNEFNSKIDIKDNTLQLLVFTPNNISFEALNKEKLDKLGFRVLKYVEDKSSLKEVLSEHYGEKVLSANLADAVLVCADLPTDVVEKVLYNVGKIGIRTFFYSDNEPFDFSRIDDEDYLEDLKKCFLVGADYMEQIRRILDADSNKVRDQYSKFFDAADRLDEDYGWGLSEFATGLLQGKPFKMDINKLRSKIDETIITFFKCHHIAPAEMDNTAVASLVADKKYYEGRKKVNIILTEELPKTTLDAEAWYKYALVAIRKLGNKDSHSSSDSDSSLELAAFTLFTEIIVWLDSVRERYKEKKCLFNIKKGNMELPFLTVEVYQIDGKDYLIANGVHLIDTKRELKAGDQVVILDTEAEKYPRTINGSRVEEVAGPSHYIVAIKD